MHVAQTVPGASVSANHSRTTLSSYDRGGFVTFVPEDATLGGLLGWLAITDLLLPVVAENGAVGVLFPALLVGAAAGVATPSVRKGGQTLRAMVVDPSRVLAGLGVTGVAVTVLLALGARAGPGTAVLFGTGVVTAGVGFAWSRADSITLTYRRVLAAAVVCWAVASVVAIGAILLFRGRLLWYGLGPRLPSLLALFALVPAGFALQQGARWRGVVTSVAAALVALVPVVHLTDRFVPFGLSTRVLFAVGEAVGLVLVGLPFLLLGAVLAVDAEGGQDSGHSRP
jgi:hypothetical protein